MYKPCDTAMLSNWVLFEALREAGLPDGKGDSARGRGGAATFPLRKEQLI